MMYSLALILRKEKKYEEALKAMSFVIEHFHWPKPSIAMFYYLQAEIYLTMGKKEEVEKTVKTFMDLPYPIANQEDSLMLVNFYKGAAQLYEKMGDKAQAIKLLAECLKITPDDKEILKLIQKYQGE
jgi:tetratricopeptide (TPR) repeat protein